jgi:purine-binding chemotaxis protein CheW
MSVVQNQEDGISLFGEDLIQLCGFKIGGQHFAIPVLEVQEVIKSEQVTRLPLAPVHIKGLINLRGQIVTLVSLRSLFGLDEKENDDSMHIIVKSGDSLFSLMVDEISDVLDLSRKSYEDTPSTLKDDIKKYINGVYKLEDDLVVQLDLDKLLDRKENK